jgi:hypothetical protein
MQGSGRLSVARDRQAHEPFARFAAGDQGEIHMESLNRIGRALLVVSALSLPAVASAETPQTAPKAATAKKDDAAKKKDHAMHQGAAKAHKPDVKAKK